VSGNVDAAPAPPDVLDDPAAGARAIRGSAVRASGYVVGSLLTLASAPLLVRYLGVVDFGRYFTVISLIALVGGVTDVGLGTVAVREYSARTGAARDAIMRQLLGARLVLTAAGVLAATAFAALAGYEKELVLGTALAGAGLIFAVVGHNVSVPLSSELRMGWVTAIDVGGKALGVALVIVLILLSAGVTAFLASTILTGIAALAVVVPLTRGRVPLRPSLRIRELAGLLRQTLPLALATVLNTLYARVVIIVMSVSAGAVATGYFGTAARTIEVAIGIPASIIGTTFPIFARAARDDVERLRYVVQRVAEVALIGGVWMTMATAVGADVISDVVIGGPDSAPVADVLRVLALALVPVCLNLTWQLALIALHRHWELLVVNGLALVVILVLTFSLVPVLAERGAAIAVVGGEMVLMAMSAVALLRASPILRPDAWVIPRVTVAAALAVAAAVVPPMPDIVAIIVVTVIYFGALMALRAIPPELRDALLRRGRRGRTRGA